MKRNALASAVLISCTALFGALTPGRSSAVGSYEPHIDPSLFQTLVDNRYFPLVPGTKFLYQETSGGKTYDNEVTVTGDTKVVMGVTCRVVHDVLRDKDAIKEDTYDWYAQDQKGNVWYFGEKSTEHLASGKVSTEGSWEAGVDGGQPGIIMKAHPAPGPAYRQEYLAGKAEDMGQVLSVRDTVTVPFGAFSSCVATHDWSMIEKGSEKKWYAPGVGLVRTESDHESSVLISVTHP
jgi:uncharacterized protein DUF3108